MVNQFILKNITDIDAIEAMAKKEKVNFLYSVGSDIAIPIISEVSNKLGLSSFLTIEQLNQLVKKGHLRTTLQQFSVSLIIFNQFQELADIEVWNTHPVILKPVDSQGSRGVFFIENIDDIHYHLEETLHFSRSKSAIIEDYLDGPEITCLVMVKRGKIIFCMINDRLTVEEYHTGIPKGHRTP